MLIGAFAGLTGCVLPYPSLDKDPPDVNSMPVILPETIVPPRTRDPVKADVGAGCQHRTFSATVIDYDGADTLHYKWILTASVDGPDTGTLSRTFELVESSVSASEQPIDTVVPDLSKWAPNARVYKDLGLDLTRERLLTVVDVSTLAPDDPTTSYNHLLQLWVSDRGFEPGVANITPQTPEGQVPQPAESASWFLTIADTSCAGEEGA